ncbi:type II toxin-antitoxin system PemK/MazF family toxin [[Limnothrix rosea] IAM M-220]|uniref:type II toxin-antitoxin system PemK/MazF family toxin n=1 Tax=[Limnothrix rosea] IAM M-220 TaxID=454133 RepID=UPI00095C83DE|nr:type II toxin-antitoxin system PemK/MazF family toxin [[Limnothrix rosea] IAM M-220]OKH19385.1 growth inhibitor PemK [[Limnothrix rosea] IAM M-220]
MKRGEVWWINFDPSVGGEIRKKRPAVIVSDNVANRNLNRVQVIPLTSNIERVYPAETLVTVDGKSSKAMADQLTTVAKQRMLNRVGEPSPDDMGKIEVVMALQLGLQLG